MNDLVNHPSHYTSHPSGVEAIEITRWMSYNLGNVVKYVWRADLKGKNIEDLEKAQFYLNDEIIRLKGNNARQDKNLQDGLPKRSHFDVHAKPTD